MSQDKNTISKKSQEKYVPTKTASELLGVHVLTLHNWEKSGKIDTIRTPGNHRLYNVEKYLKMQKINKNNDNIIEKKDNDVSSEESENKNANVKSKFKNNKQNICYIRVPCVGDKKTLKQQKDYMKQKYPDYLIIEDIGSANNFDKHGLKKIIDMVEDKSVNDIVIINKHCINKFGLDLLTYLLKKYEGGSIIVENYNTEDDTVNDIIDDLMCTISKCSSEISEIKNKKSVIKK